MSAIATRIGFADEIIELGKIDKDIVIVNCDVSSSCKSDSFSNLFPERSFNVGIAEQSAVTFAAGLASCGKKPYVVAYSIFASLRMLEMIRQEVAYPNLNVKFIATHFGFTPEFDGASHQAIEDLNVVRSIPNMNVISPADYSSTRFLLRRWNDINKPAFFRLSRNPLPSIYPPSYDRFRNAELLRKGSSTCIIACADTVHLALKAADTTGSSVIDFHSITGLPPSVNLLNFSAFVTVESGNLHGGLGSFIKEFTSEFPSPPRVLSIGVNSKFGESAPYSHLLDKNGISVDNIISKVRSVEL